ncbi:MAG TPA: TetR/AcrR family transcriptional regulator [Hyphomicrobiaceae bacterium]|nr:TetR/AcrR family transcriptional regulator [Hyphomicrobiaceae bacterium]
MPARNRVTREAIIETAGRLISETGAASMTFQMLGDRLGVSKQAIIYWFPSKADLARELIMPALEREADAVVNALKRAKTARRAIELFLRALITFHLSDLGRFRLIYAVAQFDTQIWTVAELPQVAGSVHAVTDRMYSALEQVLGQAADFAVPSRARVTAAVVHTAAVGLVSMISLADAVHDPLAHSSEALIDALVRLVTGECVKRR